MSCNRNRPIPRSHEYVFNSFSISVYFFGVENISWQISFPLKKIRHDQLIFSRIVLPVSKMEDEIVDDRQIFTS